MWNKFLLLCFIPIVIFLLCFGYFNFKVDPYHLKTNEISEGKIYSADRERAFKPLMYLNSKPEVVILGDSKSGFSINPDEISNMLNLKNGFNLSLRNATPTEIYELLKFAVNKNENLKHIILFLDFEMMGQINETNPGFSTFLLSTGFLPPEEKIASLFSLPTFCDSSETLRLNGKQKLPTIYKNNGEISEDHLINFFEKEGSFNRNVGTIVTKFRLIEEDKKKRKIFLKSYNRDFFVLSKIREFLTKQNIKYSVIILPMSKEEISAANNAYYKNWQKQLKEIFPEIYDLTLSFKDDKNLYYDSAHPKKNPTMKLLENLFKDKKIENYKYKFDENIATGKEFNGEIKIDKTKNTSSLILDKKLLKYGVIHLTAFNDIESKNAYFLLKRDDEKFLIKATRYGEVKTQRITSIITKKYEEYPLDGRGVTDNLPAGEYDVYVGEVRDNIFVTDGVKTKFTK